MVPMLMLAVPIFFSFRFITGSDFYLFYILVPVLGFMIGGVANLIVSLIATDMGRNNESEHNALSTITGIIDGTGNLGACFGQVIIGALAENIGWDASFYFLMLVSFLPCVFLFNKMMAELAELRAPRTLDAPEKEEKPSVENS
jgi:sugar phosphate permease